MENAGLSGHVINTQVIDGEQHRVQVWFGKHLLRAYRAEAAAAREYASAIGRRFPGLRVTVDKEAVDGLVQLPCEQLWTVIPP